MHMMIQYHVRMENQTFFLSAKGERARDDVEVFLTSENGHPLHNRGSDEMRPFDLSNLIADSHDDVSKRSFEDPLRSQVQLGNEN